MGKTGPGVGWDPAFAIDDHQSHRRQVDLPGGRAAGGGNMRGGHCASKSEADKVRTDSARSAAFVERDGEKHGYLPFSDRSPDVVQSFLFHENIPFPFSL